MPAKELLTTNRKALTINLDEARYGTFAEIGAGQEVARHFFQAGGAAGTVAKTISAYDMTFSDEIYGRAPRYVSRERLATMLDHEYALLRERLGAARGDRTTFFAFADTVAAKSFRGNNECHGWMGVRFQLEPGGEPHDIVIHVRMWDKENVLQQQALGIIGVNLLYGALYLHHDPRALIESLADNLGIDRIEVDMITFAGPRFAAVDNRLLSLHLVHLGLTNAALFGPDGDVRQPSEALHKRAVLVARGSFRPVTRVHLDMLDRARAQFAAEANGAGHDPVVLAEITLHHLLAGGAPDPADFLARIDLLTAEGLAVLLSNYAPYYRLSQYFRRYTREPIGMVLGVNNLVELLDERHYENLEGGILESFGRLFRHQVRLYIYPMTPRALAAYLGPGSVVAPDAALVTAATVPVPPRLTHLYAHLLAQRLIVGIDNPEPGSLDLVAREVLERIQRGDAGWREAVPPRAAAVVAERRLFRLPAGA